MSRDKEHHRRVFRTSLEFRGCLSLASLGIVAMFWWRVLVLGDVLVTLVLTSPLFILFILSLKLYMESKVILGKDALIFQEVKNTKTVQYASIRQIQFSSYRSSDLLMSFSLFYQAEVLTLDLRFFDLKTIFQILTALMELAPQAQINIQPREFPAR